MKTIILLILLSLNFFINAFSQQVDIKKDNLSDVFKTYNAKYKKVIVTLSEVYGAGRWFHYKIIYEERGAWYLTDHFVDRLLIRNDSITINKCRDCKLVFKQLVSKQKELKSENDIQSPCRKITKVVSGKDTLNKIEDLHWIADLDTQVIEYRNGKAIKRIIQLNPSTALQICPEDEERKVFRDLVNAVKNVH